MTWGLDKSKDWRLQMSPVTIWYLEKTSEGDTLLHTGSESTFKATAKQVNYVTHEDLSRSSADGLQVETSNFHLFREQFPDGFGPNLGARIFALGSFWIVEEIDKTDRDPQEEVNRVVLTARKERTAVTS